MGWYFLVGMVVVVAVPAGVLGFFASAAHPDLAPSALACPALSPHPGALALHLFFDDAAQEAALDAGSLKSYLEDRTGVPVSVVERLGDEAALARAAHEGASGTDVFVKFVDAPLLRGIPTAAGTADVLGYARSGEACVHLAFQPSPAQACAVGGETVQALPVFAALAHELGHVVGLKHSAAGLMGHTADFRLCGTDTFDAAQRAAFA